MKEKYYCIDGKDFQQSLIAEKQKHKIAPQQGEVKKERKKRSPHHIKNCDGFQSQFSIMRKQLDKEQTKYDQKTFNKVISYENNKFNRIIALKNTHPQQKQL